jgi:hypothetical protein
MDPNIIFSVYNENIEKNKNLNNIHILIDNIKSKEPNLIIEGNYCMYNNDENFNIFLNKKIANLLWCVNQLPSDNLNICEIGFNAGHSSSLIGNILDKKTYNFYIFDIAQHIYTKPCFELFKSTFKNDNNNIYFIEGNSIITIPEFINENRIGTFDFIHIDGGHTKECIDNDFKNADILIKNNGIIIIDDTNISFINDAVDFYINNNNYVELFLLDIKSFVYPHRIIQKKMI